MESARNYFPGGFHPIHLGNTFKDGRYTIIHKLGSGSSSTVWLTKDSTTETYVSLKVLAANALTEPRHSQDAMEELQILSRLRDAAEEPGKGCIVRLFDDFVHNGPNGQHQCIVTELLGPDLYSVIVEEDETEVSLKTLSKAIIRQLTYATRFLHRNKVAHRDLHSSNILLTSPMLSSINEEDITRYYTCEEIYKEEIRHGVNGIKEPPHAPLYIVHALDPLPLLQLCLSDPANVRIKICDFSAASIITEATQPRRINSPLVFRAPEVILCESSIPTMSTEIWALAVLLYLVDNGGGCPFSAGFFLKQPDAHILMRSIVLKLGKPPEPIWLAWTKRAEFFDENGRPLHKAVKEAPLFLGPKETDNEERVLFKGMIRKMLMLEPTERTTIDEIVKSEWFVRYCDGPCISS